MTELCECGAVLRTGDEVVEGHVCPLVRAEQAEVARLRAEAEAGVLAERELDVLLALEQCVALGIFASSETTAAAAAIIRLLVDQRDEALADHQGTLNQLHVYLAEHAAAVDELSEVKRDRDELRAELARIDLIREGADDYGLGKREGYRAAVEIVEGVKARWDGSSCPGAYDAGWDTACRECLKALREEKQ